MSFKTTIVHSYMFYVWAAFESKSEIENIVDIVELDLVNLLATSVDVEHISMSLIIPYIMTNTVAVIHVLHCLGNWQWSHVSTLFLNKEVISKVMSYLRYYYIALMSFKQHVDLLTTGLVGSNLISNSLTKQQKKAQWLRPISQPH